MIGTNVDLAVDVGVASVLALANSKERKRAALLEPFVRRSVWLLDLHSMHEPSLPLTWWENSRAISNGRESFVRLSTWWLMPVTVTEYECATMPNSACRIRKSLTPVRYWLSADITVTSPVWMLLAINASAFSGRQAPSRSHERVDCCQSGKSPTPLANGRGK